VTKQSRCERLIASLICFIAAYAPPALAQSYPAKPIELVSSTGAGGGSDLVCRVVADIITREKLLPQSVYVVNKPGGGGAIGQTYVSGRRGDPYVFMLAATNLVAAPIRTGLDIGLDKFQPLGAIGFDLNAISVAEGSPYRTLKDLIAAAREKPGTISVGTTSPGGGAHAMMHRLQKLTGARFNIVSFKSGAETVTGVMGGHLHATAENLGEVLQAIETKRLRLLAIPSARRLAAFPNVPTLKEQGFDIEAGAMRGFVSPAGVSRDVTKLLEDTLARVHKSAAWKDYVAKNMYEDVYMNSEEFARWLAAQHTEMLQFLTDIGLAHKK
jgi:tripartite-type tricarboxylate transporter receptor subunit TctC